jgi:predicted hotdog family 3-hydroxylacyl-ACP dehydratase
MKPCTHALAALLPHRAPMILLDEILGYDEATLVAGLTVRATSLFLEGEGIAVHVGLEYMAQACGAYAGALARDRGEPVRIGFVLGTRRYRAFLPWFRLGDRLVVSASLLYGDAQMGAFDCRIEIDGRLAAEAQLNVYQPDPAELAAQGGLCVP